MEYKYKVYDKIKDLYLIQNCKTLEIELVDEDLLCEGKDLNLVKFEDLQGKYTMRAVAGLTDKETLFETDIYVIKYSTLDESYHIFFKKEEKGKILIYLPIKGLRYVVDNSYAAPYIDNDYEKTNIHLQLIGRLTTLTCLFTGCKYIEDIDVNYLDTSEVTNMSYTFAGCKNLKELDLSNFNTSKVTTMRGMFSDAGLEKIDVSSFDTSNVRSFYSMFKGCANLKELNLSNFNTKNVHDIGNFVEGCANLKELDLSNFDTRNMLELSSVFKGCERLDYLNLSSFRQKIAFSGRLFSDCYKLKEDGIVILPKSLVDIYDVIRDNVPSGVYKRWCRATGKYYKMKKEEECQYYNKY